MLRFHPRSGLSVRAALAVVLLLGLDPHVAPAARALVGGLSFDDPQLTYSTTFGRGVGEIREIAVDGDGNILIAGSTTERYLFPLVNAVDSTFGDSGGEGFVAKINADGDSLVYSTYLGGDGDDWISALAVDAAGNAYVVGTTLTLDFPTKNGLQPLPNMDGFGFVRDGFVAKLDPDGDLVWATHLGGEGGDEANDVVVDADGAVYVVGGTTSVDFPSLNAFQSDCKLSPPPFEKCSDAFVTKLAADGESIEFSTFLGGTATGFGEKACGVDIDGFGNVYVIGENRSEDFPVLGAIQEQRPGGLTDLFVTKLAATGSTLIWSTHLGGSADEFSCNVLVHGASIAVDSQGDAVLSAFTTSTDMPISGGFQPAHAPGGGTDGYVAKITSGGQLAWSTYLGGEGSDYTYNVAVAADGTPVIVGATGSSGFPVTADALAGADCPSSATATCQSDAFVTVLGAGDGSLVFSTLLGGDDLDQANGVDIDADGTIFIAGYTRTDAWPLVDPLDAIYRGGGTTQPFVSAIGSAPASTPGDANGDGMVTASDALLTLSAALSAASCELCVCDMNGDGSLTATDALIVLNLAVGLPVQINTPAC